VDSCFKCGVKAGEKTTSGLSSVRRHLAEYQIGDDTVSTGKLGSIPSPE
jgi:hypothetical protein